MDAPWTAVHDTPNKSVRQNVARKGVVLHHAAMTSLDGLRRMEVEGTKEVSSTAICKDGHLELVVADDWYRPWSLSSAWADSAFRSVETCNESTDGWTISDASHWSLARAVAYWATTDGFWPHRDGAPATWTVIGHREVNQIYGVSYSTACPGALDLDLVVARAQQLILGTAPQTTKEHDMQYYIANTPSKDGIIPNGAVFAQGADGILRRVIAEEWSLIAYWNKNGRPTPTWEIPGDQISALVRTVGLYEITGGTGANQYRPTGRIIYDATGPVWPPSPQTAGLAELVKAAVESALAGVSIEAKVDTVGLVKAVNDDLAARIKA